MAKGNMLDQILVELGDRTYKLLLSKGATHHEAEDIIQNSYYKLLNVLPEINEQQIKAWFFRVALNDFIDEKRKLKRVVTVEQNFFDDFTQESDAYETIKTNNEIEIELSKVKEEYREIMILKYYYDLSYVEIAEILEIKPNSVKQKLARARKSISDKKREKDEPKL